MSIYNLTKTKQKSRYNVKKEALDLIVSSMKDGRDSMESGILYLGQLTLSHILKPIPGWYSHSTKGQDTIYIAYSKENGWFKLNIGKEIQYTF